MKSCFLPFLSSIFSGLVLVESRYSTNQPCEIGRSSKVLLSRDSLSGNFTFVTRLSEDDIDFSIGKYRQLQASDMYDGSLRTEIIPGISSSDMDADEEFDRELLVLLDENTTDIDSELFYAWECSCFESQGFIETVYCPLDIDTCLRPARSSGIRVPACRNLPKNYDSRRWAVLVCAAWFSVLVLSFFCSRLGSSLCGFLISKCFPCWNERAVDYLMRRNPDRARHMIRRFLVRQQRALEQAIERSNAEAANSPSTDQPQMEAQTREILQTEEEKAPPTSLALKTKKYCVATDKSSESELKSEEEAESDLDQCSICFNTFIDGERVGALKCGHLFHVDCLKMWLQRRNTCPLCQTKEIAQPRYDEIEPLSSAVVEVSDESEQEVSQGLSDES